MTRVLPFLLMIGLLAACSPDKGTVPEAAVAPATEATLPAEAANAAPAYSASEAGVGPLSAATPFDRETVAALFPGSEVKSTLQNQEGVQTPVLTVIGPGELLLEIQEGYRKAKVGRVLVQGGPVVGPRGEAILDPWSRFGFAGRDCLIGVEGQLLCRRPGAPSLAYVFAIPGFEGEVEAPPPPEALLVEKAFLQAFLWQAPSVP